MSWRGRKIKNQVLIKTGTDVKLFLETGNAYDIFYTFSNRKPYFVQAVLTEVRNVRQTVLKSKIELLTLDNVVYLSPHHVHPCSALLKTVWRVKDMPRNFP